MDSQQTNQSRYSIKKQLICSRGYKAALILASFFLFTFGFASGASAAVLTLSPPNGTFTVGSTFTVSVFLNTDGKTINTIGTTVSYPADKLQLVSPSTGNSIISLWTSLPHVDNQRGIVSLQGGIPGGIKVSNGIITTLTFRVKSVGTAVVKFTDDSKVLLNDGKGSDDLEQTTNGVYTLVLPPPAGPLIASDTHPDQSRWYANPSVSLTWTVDGQHVEGYSYILNNEPVDLPDDISEGTKSSIVYKSLPDGIHYFHIKALKDGTWGGTSHYAIKIDTTPPAAFPAEVIPGSRTTRKQPIIQFESTDALSGIDHYELKLLALKIEPQNGQKATAYSSSASQPLFIEAQSPYVTPQLEQGSYDVIIRAFDVAGNFQETIQHIAIVTPIFSFISSSGLVFGDSIIIPWFYVIIIFAILIIILGYAGWRVRSWHHRVLEQKVKQELPNKVQSQLEELVKYRQKYGKLAVVVLMLCATLLGGMHARAEEVEVTPPVITTVSRNISNSEIFYVGGKIDIASTTITIYLQNLSTGETLSEHVVSDKRGEWFYRHDGFLTSGNYLLWAQSKLGSLVSPPSPQVTLSVHTTALQIGGTRLSLESLYAILLLTAVALALILICYILVHAYHGKKHLAHLTKQIREAEESVRRGFAVLKRDIQAELEVIHKAKLSKELSNQEQQKEEQLLSDLESVEKYIGKEIWDLEHLRH